MARSRLSRTIVVPSSIRRESASWFCVFQSSIPGPPIPLSTLQATSRDAACKTEGQDGVAVSFLVGLFHSLQHAGLSRRTLINAPLPEIANIHCPARLTRQVELNR